MNKGDVLFSISQLAELAAESLAALTYMIEDDGRIRRCHSFLRNGNRIGYNQLRHAGTVWAMLSIFERDNPSPIADHFSTEDKNKVNKKLLSATDYLFDHYLISNEHIHGSAILSDQKIKLGANALSILMSTSAANVMKDNHLSRHCNDLSRYILSQYDGHLLFQDSLAIPTYDPIEWKSNYYTAQSLFSLIVWAKHTDDKSLTEFVIEALKRSWNVNYGIHSDSHWLMYAVSATYEQTGAEFLIDYGRRIALEVLNDKKRRGKMFSAPIACQSESLTRFVRMIKFDGSRKSSGLVDECMNQLHENIRLQMMSRDKSGLFFASPKVKEIRVDYTQHNLSSIDGYISLMV
jgi:hypothetical protein